MGMNTSEQANADAAEFDSPDDPSGGSTTFGSKDRPPESPRSSRSYDLARLARSVIEIGEHTAAFLASILSIWIVDRVLTALLGKDFKFYDILPVRYVIDSGHLAVLLRFVWNLATEVGQRPGQKS